MVSSRDPTDGMGHYIFADEEGLGYFGLDLKYEAFDSLSDFFCVI